MAGRLEGKVAIVTGAAHGMGASHAVALAKEGADVAAVDICHDIPEAPYGLGTEAEQSSVVKEVEALGRRAIAINCDVSNADEVEKMVKSVVDKFGKVDILVNNAAIALVAAPLWELREEQWDKLMDVNLKGTFLCCKYVLPHMIKQQYGKIINIGSVWGREGAATAVAYSASKGGIHNFTHALAKDVAPYNINVNAVAPAITRTPMLEAAAEALGATMGMTPEEFYEFQLQNLTILNRDIPAEDVSNAVVFLASEEARSIDGMVIYVDGGHRAA